MSDMCPSSESGPRAHSDRRQSSAHPPIDFVMFEWAITQTKLHNHLLYAQHIHD